jgi:plastocyanin
MVTAFPLYAGNGEYRQGGPRRGWLPACYLVLTVGATLALLALLLVHSAAGTVRAAETWEVQVGAAMPFGMEAMAGGAPSDHMAMRSSGQIVAQAFGPDPLTIHTGDSVTFTWAASDVPHTVTFNSGQPPLPDMLPGPGQGELTLGPASAPAGLPSPDATSVTYDGTFRLSSGLRMRGATLTVTFTRPGRYGYVCTIHEGMRGEIDVVDPSVPLPETPAQAKARGQATLAALLGMTQEMADQVRSVSLGSLHTVAAGVGSGFGGSAIMFVPGDITVRRGDQVIWTVTDPFEIHTVTFTSGANPPAFVDVRPQPQGPPLIVIPANVASPAGGTTYTGTGYVNSGIITPGNSFILRIDAPPGTYMYHCLVHPSMHGTITVTP